MDLLTKIFIGTTCGSCCLSLLLIAAVIGLVILIRFQQKAIRGFKKWSEEMVTATGQRMFDTPDLMRIRHWARWINPTLLSHPMDKELLTKIDILIEEGERLKQEQGAGDEDIKQGNISGTPEQLMPKAPPTEEQTIDVDLTPGSDWI